MTDPNGVDTENFGANQVVKDHLEKRQFKSFEVIIRAKLDTNTTSGQNMIRYYAVKLLPVSYNEEATSLLSKL